MCHFSCECFLRVLRQVLYRNEILQRFGVSYISQQLLTLKQCVSASMGRLICSCNVLTRAGHLSFEVVFHFDLKKNRKNICQGTIMSLALAVVCTSRLGTWASLQYIFFYRCSCWVDLLQSYVCFKRRILILWGWFLFFDLWDSCYRNCGSARILRKSVGRTFVW